MCGRFIFIEPESVYDRFEITEKLSLPLQPSYNIAPSQNVLVVYRENPNRIRPMKWGFVPHFLKDTDKFKGLINARAETLSQKPFFQEAFRHRRCLIPTNGFYEWKKHGKTKIPYFIYLKNTPLFAFAGIYDIYVEENGKESHGFAIITTEPNSLIADLHNRMPLIIPVKAEKLWLNQEITDNALLLDLLKPYPSAEMSYHQVSLLVNNPRNNSPQLIKEDINAG